MESSLRGGLDVDREVGGKNRETREEDDFDAATLSLLDDIESILGEMPEAQNDSRTPRSP